MINIVTPFEKKNDPFACAWYNLAITDSTGRPHSRRSGILVRSTNNQNFRVGDRPSNRNALRGRAQIVDAFNGGRY